VEDVAGEALRVDAHERRRVGSANIAHHECDGFFEMSAAVRQTETTFETVDPEGSVFGGKVGFGCLGEFKVHWGWNNFIIMNGQAWNST